MLFTKQLLTLQDFKSLKKGDTIVCEWNCKEYNKKDEIKLPAFGTYKIKDIIDNEIYVQKTLYFNYVLFLKFVEGKSKLKSAILITQH